MLILLKNNIFSFLKKDKVWVHIDGKFKCMLKSKDGMCNEKVPHIPVWENHSNLIVRSSLGSFNKHSNNFCFPRAGHKAVIFTRNNDCKEVITQLAQAYHMNSCQCYTPFQHIGNWINKIDRALCDQHYALLYFSRSSKLQNFVSKQNFLITCRDGW